MQKRKMFMEFIELRRNAETKNLEDAPEKEMVFKKGIIDVLNGVVKSRINGS